IRTLGKRYGALGEKFGQGRIVRAENQEASGPLGERLEFAADRVEVGVVIEMFGIYVQDNSVFGLELPQRAVAFVGLDDEEGNLPHSCPPGRLSPGGGGEGRGEGSNRSAVVSVGFVGRKRRIRSEARVAFKLRHARADGVARPV